MVKSFASLVWNQIYPNCRASILFTLVNCKPFSFLLFFQFFFFPFFFPTFYIYTSIFVSSSFKVWEWLSRWIYVFFSSAQSEKCFVICGQNKTANDAKFTSTNQVWSDAFSRFSTVFSSSSYLYFLYLPLCLSLSIFLFRKFTVLYFWCISYVSGVAKLQSMKCSRSTLSLLQELWTVTTLYLRYHALSTFFFSLIHIAIHLYIYI